MAQVGRISGPLLEANLERNGIDLAFRNDLDTRQLLYIDVNNGRIGVNTGTPNHSLTVNGTTRTRNLIADYDRIAGFNIANATLSAIGNIELNAADAIITPAIDNGTIFIDGNYISTTQSNANIDITPNGTGETNVVNNLNVFGSLHTQGSITLDGTIIFGNANTDAVDFNADVNSDIIPDLSNTYTLGSITKRWDNLFTNLVNGQSLSTDSLLVSGIDFNKSQGNIIYVAQNGTDTNRGDHVLAPVASIKRALELVDASVGGPTVVYVFPGDYEEETPLVIPSNVSVVGADIRNVKIFPTSYTQSEDVFHLNGETTVSNLTIKNFFYDDVNNTGHAFRFAPNAVISTRSPYVQNVSVITNGSTTLAPTDIYVDPEGLGLSYSSNSITVTQSGHTEAQVASWVGKTLVTYFGDGYPVDFYTVTGYIDEPDDPGVLWRIELAETFDPAHQGQLFSIYPNTGETIIVGSASSAADYSTARSYPKSSLPGDFNTTVGEFWTCQYGEGVNVVDFVEEDPVDSSWWKVHFKNTATFTFGPPIFTSPSSGGSILAGRGAWIDGSEMNAASVDASMLFHSCTFIVPNADAITMTNGVRVEWLNSFTYFANRGLYAVNGVTGRTSQDGSTVNYGAEIRSIGSANVYGNYGAVADGADCLMYLIQHNFAYIGTGTDSSNDNSLVIQANEVVEQNNGQIHYVTTDHTGAFRVGDSFFIDFETGSTSVDLSSLTAASINGLVVTTGSDRTFITGEKVETGNIKISENLIETLAGNFNIVSASGELNLNNSSNVSGNLDVVGNLTFGGNLNLLGDQVSDTLKFNVDFDQDLNPNQTSIYNLGSPSKAWLRANVSNTFLDNIRIYDNVIETTNSNSDLEMRASGTGTVNFKNNTFISNDLTINGLLFSDNILVDGNLSQNGSFNQVGSATIGGTVTVGNDADINQSASFKEIIIDDNFITTSSSNADLELRASGLGIVKFLNSVEVDNNLLTTNLNANLNFTVNNETTFNVADISSIRIENNSISTTVSNANLELRAPASSLFSGGTSLTGSETTLDGGTAITSIFESILDGGSALSLAGGESVIIGKNNTVFDQNLSIIETTYLNNVTVDGDITHTGQRVINGNYELLGDLFIDGILIKSNFISTTESNSDLELRASGAGKIIITEQNITNNLEVSSDTSLQDITINGEITHIGNRGQIGNYFQTGNLLLSGDISVSGSAQLENLAIEGNILKSTISNSDLELRASGTGKVLIPTNNARINNDLFVASIIAGNVTVDADLVLNEIVIPPSIIEIDDNFISTKVSNADLELRANGTGAISIPSNNVQINNDLTVSTDTVLQSIIIAGSLLHTGDRTQTGNYNQTGSLIVDGILTTESEVLFEDISINDNIITTTLSNSDLELRASGSGNVLINSSMQVNNNLSVTNIVTGNITIDADLVLNEIVIPPSIIEIDDNFISTKVSNADLELKANGTGQLVFNNEVIATQQMLVNGATSLVETVIQGTVAHIGDRTQLGNTILTGELSTSELATFNSLVQIENISIDQNILETTQSNSDLELRANGSGNIVVPNNNVEILQNASAGQITTNNITIDGSFAFDLIEISTDIRVFDNVITTANSNSDLELRANGSGSILIKDLYVKDSEIQTLISDITFSSPTVVIDATGALKIPTSPIAPTEQGTIKFNTATGFFEGRNNEVITLSSGLYSTNRRTSVLAHPTNNTINLTVNNAVVGTVAATGLTIHEIQVDNITLRSKNILTTLANPNLELTAPGSGSIVIDDIAITDNVIENGSTGLLTIANTGFGKVKFTGGALAIPVGTTAERPVNPPVGDTRWNTSTSILETWDGNQYISAAGISEAISETEFSDLLLEYTLIFG